MASSMMKFIKGMSLGVMVGCVAGAVGNHCMHSKRKGFKKNVGKALKNMSELVEEVSDMF